jgi:hypothetical protein
MSLLGFVAIWGTWQIDTPDAIIALEMAVVGIGIGLTFSPISAAIINSATQAERGVASALVIILRLIGMTVSVSSLTTYGLYRVNQLAILAQQTPDFNTATFINIYANSTVQVLGEMGFIGAVVCGLAIVPALFLSRQVKEP